MELATTLALGHRLNFSKNNLMVLLFLLKVWVCEGLLDEDPLVRVEGQHLLQQVQRLRVGVGEQSVPRYLREMYIYVCIYMYVYIQG